MAALCGGIRGSMVREPFRSWAGHRQKPEGEQSACETAKQYVALSAALKGKRARRDERTIEIDADGGGDLQSVAGVVENVCDRCHRGHWLNPRNKYVAAIPLGRRPEPHRRSHR